LWTEREESDGFAEAFFLISGFISENYAARLGLLHSLEFKKNS
jgi:hypothetical protein